MKKKNNTFVKIMASLALAAITVSIIGTWILFLYEIYFNPTPEASDLSPEELEQLLEQIQLQENIEAEILWDEESIKNSALSVENEWDDWEIQQ